MRQAFSVVLLLLISGGAVLLYTQRNYLIEYYLISGAGYDYHVRNQSLPVRERQLALLIQDLADENDSSPYVISIVKKYGGLHAKHRGSLAGKTVLEIGPGKTLGAGMLFALSGAAAYHGVDIYRDPMIDDPAPLRNMLLIARAMEPELIARPLEEVVKDDGKKLTLDPAKVFYHYPHESFDLPVPDASIDYLYSNASFEHFLKVDETIRAIHRVLKPGAVTAHLVDLRDHKDLEHHPFGFLKYSAAEYAKSRDYAPHLYTNRVRAGAYRRLFEEAGFEILEWNELKKPEHTVTEEMRKTFDPEFQKLSLDELSVLNLWIVAAKRGS